MGTNDKPTNPQISDKEKELPSYN